MLIRHRLIHVLLTLAVCSPLGNAVMADSSSPTMVVFSKNGSNSPRYATWNGSSWSGAASMPSVSDEPYWVVLKNCPTRNETACVTLNEEKDLHVMFYNGSSWGSATKLQNDADDEDKRAYDLAYEQESGDCLIAYFDDETEKIGYYTYNGSTLSGQQSLSLPSGDRCRLVTLYPKPDSNVIFLLAAHDKDDAHLSAAVWDGSSWGSWTTLETSLQSDSKECYSLAFEGQSNEALVVYAEKDQSRPRYRTWNGSGWSSEQQMPDIGDKAQWVRLAANPASDEVIFASLDDDKDINACVWNGSNWGSTLEVENNVQDKNRRQFDVAYEFCTNDALLVYHQEDQDKIRYRTWNGSSWSAEIQGTQINNRARVIQLRTGTTAGEVFIAASDSGDDLEMIRWDGSSMSITQTLESSLGGDDKTEQFMVAVPAMSAGGAPALTGWGDASGSSGFGVVSTTSEDDGSGLHWGDLDDDGDLDAIITGNSLARLVVNNNAGQSFTPNVFGTGNHSKQGALLDIDNDGDLDFWHRDEILFRNDGSASFSDIGNQGFGDPSSTIGLAAADVNRDGWCDVVMFSANGNWIGHHQGKGSTSLVGTNDASYGVNDVNDFGSGGYVSSGDVNNDGLLDFFYHFNGGKLFLSVGDGTYSENASGISVVTGSSVRTGSAWGDYDNDGDLDLFVPRYADGAVGYLWRNNDGSFTDVTAAAGLTDTSAQRSCCWGDYDNDGDLDLFIAGHSDSSNTLYDNQGDGTFAVAWQSMFGCGGSSHDAVFVDYDNDGDLDLAVTQQNAASVLLRNDTNTDAYLKVRVIGRGCSMTNAAGVGVRIDLYDAAGTTFLARRDIGVARGFGGTEPLWAHFGGVTNATTYTVKVYFTSRSANAPHSVTVVPASTSTTIGSTTISQMLTIREPNNKEIVWREVPNPERGACCASGCTYITQVACTAQGGTYQGDGTQCNPPCDPDPCP